MSILNKNKTPLYVTLETKDLLLGVFIAACTGHDIAALILMVLMIVSAYDDRKKGKG